MKLARSERHEKTAPSSTAFGGRVNPVLRRSVAIVLIPALGGCQSFWNPYVKSPDLANDLGRPKNLRFVGDIETAIEAANAQRELYYKAVGNHAIGRNIASSFLIALGAWTVYKGVTTDSVGARRNIALASATGGATYAFGNWFTNNRGEAAYLTGFRGITCSIWRMRPFLIPQTEFDQWQGSVRSLKRETETLDDQINEMQARKNQLYETPGGDKLMVKLNGEIGAAIAARKAGERQLAKATVLKGRIETAGFSLRRRVELITASVSEEVQRGEPRLEQLDAIVAKFTSQLNKNVDSLRPDPLNLRDADEFEASAGGGAGAGGGAAPVPAAAPTPVGQPAPGTAGQQIDKAKADLDRVRKDLGALKSSTGKADKATAAEIKRLQGAVAALGNKVASSGAVIANPPADAAGGFSYAEARIDLQRQKALVYQMRNEVNQMFSRVYGLYLSNKGVEQCQPLGASILSVTPDEDETSLAAGGLKKYAITGGEGIPRIFLTGQNAGGDAEVTLAVAIEGGNAVATIKAQAKLPPGPLYLVITDGAGRQKEEIKIIPEQPAEKAKPDPAVPAEKPPAK